MRDKSGSKLDKIDQDLYSQNPEAVPKSSRTLTAQTSDHSRDWKPMPVDDDLPLYEIPVEPHRVGAWVFAVVALLFCAGSFYFAWDYVVNKAGAGNNVNVTVTGPVSTPGGREFTSVVAIENRNNFPIDFVDLVVTYPPGTKDPRDISIDLTDSRESLGSVPAGQRVTRSISSILFGAEREKQPITVTAEYRIPDSNAPYSKSKTFDVLIETAPVEFVLDTLKEATINQEVILSLNIRSNTDQELRNMLVKASYPDGFNYIGSVPEPLGGNNIWSIASLKALSTSTIKIRGNFSGDSEVERFFRFEGGVADKLDNKKIAGLFASSLEKVNLVKPFLATDLLINDEPASTEVFSTAGRVATAKIEYKNNLEVPLTDVTITARLSGQALDKKSIDALGGFYKSVDNTITWNKQNTPDLSMLMPGREGFVTFTLATIPFEKFSALVKNQEVDIDISVAAKRASDSRVPEEIKSSIERKLKVSTEMLMNARAVYYIGPFTNSGPLPPKPEQKTTYTVIWTLTNTSNDISNATVTGVLPQSVSWLGQVSPAGDKVVFDEETGKVTWNAGSIPAGTGHSRQVREVAFQVSLFPNANEVGNVPNLVTDMAYTGIDAFTKQTISEKFQDPVNTRLSTDPNFANTMEQVTE